MFLLIISLLLVLLWLFLSQFNYQLAVQLVVGMLPVYVVRLTVFGLPTNLLELSVAAVAVGSLASREAQARWPYAWRRLPSWFLGLLGAFVLAAVIATEHSAVPRVSLGILKGWIGMPLLLSWLVATVSLTRAERRAVWHSLRWSAVIVALLGLLQIPFLHLYRVMSIYDVPNSLALFLVPITVASWWQKRWFSGSILTLAILGTQSIGAWLTLLVMSLGSGRLRRRVIVLLLLGLIVLTLSGRLPYLLQPLHGGAPNSASVRWQLWQASVDLLGQQPLLGVGLGQFEPAYQAWLTQRFDAYQTGEISQAPLPEFVFRDPHNWILSFWLNTGLLGLLSFAGLHFLILRRAWQQWSRLSLTDKSTILALLSLLLFGLVEAIYWKNDLATLQLSLLTMATISLEWDASGRGRRRGGTKAWLL